MSASRWSVVRNSCLVRMRQLVLVGVIGMLNPNQVCPPSVSDAAQVVQPQAPWLSRQTSVQQHDADQSELPNGYAWADGAVQANAEQGSGTDGYAWADGAPRAHAEQGEAPDGYAWADDKPQP